MTTFRILRALREFNRAQWLPSHELRRRSEVRLASLLRHATENVPFYRGRDPQSMPVMNKSAYRSHAPEAFTASNLSAARRLEKATSGSTGVPFRFAVDRAALPIAFASHLSYDSWIGLRPFDRCLRVAVPPPSASPPSGLPWLQDTHERWTQRRISVWDLDAQHVEDLWERIEAFQPAFLFGYTGALAALADLLQRRGLRLSRQLRGVITTSEALSPPRRRILEEYFRAPITNRYGLREFGFFSAQSCAASPERFHVNTELVVCEILRPDGSPAQDGETGRIVLTDLWNYARPFIRYDTGDMAARLAGVCSCGRSLPLLGPIEGRSEEWLTTASGKMISPGLLGHYLFVDRRHGDAVRHYQLVQEHPRHLTLLVVPGDDWSQLSVAPLRDDLSHLLGPGTEVSVQTVSEIAPERSGKRPIVKTSRMVH